MATKKTKPTGRGRGRPPLDPEERRRGLHCLLPPDLLDALRERAEEEGTNQTAVLERALRRELARKPRAKKAPK